MVHNLNQSADELLIAAYSRSSLSLRLGNIGPLVYFAVDLNLTSENAVFSASIVISALPVIVESCGSLPINRIPILQFATWTVRLSDEDYLWH
jgi:hypothetical protein